MPNFARAPTEGPEAPVPGRCVAIVGSERTIALMMGSEPAAGRLVSSTKKNLGTLIAGLDDLRRERGNGVVAESGRIKFMYGTTG